MIRLVSLSAKAGSTFVRLCSYSSGGVPVNLTGSTVRASVRSKNGTLVQELSVTMGDQTEAPGTFVLGATAVETAAWSGTLEADFRIESAGTVTHSQTFVILVEPAITI